MKKVAIVDYDAGNIYSVSRAVERCGGEPLVTYFSKDFEMASSIILPGVGSFSEGMHNIHKRNLNVILTEQVLERKTPFLGICLGMQLLATKGFEGGETDGLGWIKGEVRQLKPDKPNVKLPHIGWNEVNFAKVSPLFEGIPSGKDFYFVHNFYFDCENKEEILAWVTYCNRFASVVAKENIFGVQFHPEKSLQWGLKIIRNFLAL